MGLPALRDALAGGRVVRKGVPVNDGDSGVRFAESPRGEQAGNARADHYGVTARVGHVSG